MKNSEDDDAQGFVEEMYRIRKTLENCPTHGAAHLAKQHWLLRDERKQAIYCRFEF